METRVRATAGARAVVVAPTGRWPRLARTIASRPRGAPARRTGRGLAARAWLAIGVVAIAFGCGGSSGPTRPGGATAAPAPASSAPVSCGAAAVLATEAAGPPPRIQVQSGHAEFINSLAFSPDGSRFATRASDGVRVWDAADRRLLAAPPKPPDCRDLTGLAWLDAGRLFVACQAHIALFDVDRNAYDARELPAGYEVVTIPRGRARVAFVDSYSARLYGEDLSPLGELSFQGGGNNFRAWGEPRASADGRTLIAGIDHGMTLWRARADGAFEPGVYRPWPAPKALSGPVAVSPSGAKVAYASASQRAKPAGFRGDVDRLLVVAAEGPAAAPVALELPWAPKAFGESSIAAIEFVDEEHVVAGAGRTLVSWDLRTRRVTWTAPVAHPLLAIDASGARLAAERSEGVAAVFDAKGGRLLGELGHALARPGPLAWLDDDRLAIASSLASPSRLRVAERDRDRAALDELERSRVRTFSLSDATLASEATVARLVDLVPSAGRLLELTREHRRSSRCGARRLGYRVAGDEREHCFPDLTGSVGAFRDDVLLDPALAGPALIDRRTGKRTPLAAGGGGCDGQGGSLGDSAFSASGAYVLADHCGLFHVWDRGGRLVFREKPSRDHLSRSAAFSLDGRRVAIFEGQGRGRRNRVVVADLPSGAARSFEVGPPDGSDQRAAAFAPGPTSDTWVLLSGAGELEVYEGGALRTRVDVGFRPGFSGRLHVSPSGKRALLVRPEGSIELRELPSTQLVATLADFRDGEWAIFSPGGAHAGTAEVSDRVAWVFDAPAAGPRPTGRAEAFTFEQFSSHYRDPALLRRRLGGEAVDAEAIAARPPRIEFARPVSGGATAEAVVRVSSGRRVDLVRAFVEGMPVATKPVCAARGEVSLNVPLLAGANRLAFVAYDDRGFASNAAEAIAAAPPGGRAPDAFVVAVGVDRYPRLPAGMQLGAAEADARGLVEAFREGSRAARLFGRVRSTALLGERASAPAILEALRGLSEMRPEDVAIVFFAGHGVKRADSGDAVLLLEGAALAPDGKSLAPATYESASVSWRQIAEALGRARGRVVVLLDACHSGHLTRELVVPNDAFAAALAARGRAGVVVFAAAKGRQLSYESGGGRGLSLDLGDRAELVGGGGSHGYFTGAVLASLGDPAADLDGDGKLQLSELLDEVTRRVRGATGELQTPWVARREVLGDFALAAAAR
jgi:Caspase domain